MSRTLDLNFDFTALALPIGRHRAGVDVVPLQPICKALGLDWEIERARVHDPDGWQRFGSCLFAIKYAGERREMVCIRLDRVIAFLATIDLDTIPKQGNDAAIAFLLRKQKEWGAVLWRHSLGPALGVQH